MGLSVGMNKHLYLTGYRGTGKTSVANQLAKMIDRPRIDLDDLVCENRGISIAEIFATEGESGFRDAETEALRAVAELSGAIVSLGGGAILREENRTLIRTSGKCVWLMASAESISLRIAADSSSELNRPALTDLSPVAEVHSLLELRKPFYKAAADFSVDTTNKSVNEVAKEVVQWWKSIS